VRKRTGPIDGRPSAGPPIARRPPEQCWAARRYGRDDIAEFRRLGPRYEQCRQPPRPGCLTCWWHRHLEGEARRLEGQGP
jgi:hypothetical protein